MSTSTKNKQHDNYKELEKRNQMAEHGGGESRIQRQHEAGKFTARERIAMLLDEGTFVETDKLVMHQSSEFGMDKQKVPGDGLVSGYGKIDGRLVYVFAFDFTIFGGTLSRSNANKIIKVMDLAVKMGAPVIGLNDSGGARIQEGVKSLSGYADIFYRNVQASGVIPQISAILGPCAGGAVYSPALTDFIFMSKNTSYMFVTGPDVIKAVTHEEISKEELGGAETHNKNSGVAHFMGESEEQTLMMIRELIGFIPSNNMEDPPIVETQDSSERKTGELNELVPSDPNKPYDMRKFIETVVDDNNFFEVQPFYAQNMVTGFGRLGGRSVGIIANNPLISAGALDIKASTKAARFIRFCDSFNIPIITFEDVPGFMPGINQEIDGIIRHGAKMLYAYAEATVPKITLITRKAYGGAYCVMASKHLGADVNFAYPNAEIAVMGAEGAVNILYRNLKPEDKLEAIEDYKLNLANPFKSAELGYIDEVILPEDTRLRLIQSLEMTQNKVVAKMNKKHGNIPL